MMDKTFDILLIEDNPADVRLAREAFKVNKSKSSLNVVHDGVEAMDFLHQKGSYISAARPDLIYLDLNLPRKGGREVLADIKNDGSLKRIPVVVLTTSRADTDIITSYNLSANCYIVKPADLDEYFKVFSNTEHFWRDVVTRSPQ